MPCVVVSTTDVLGIVQAIAGDAVELHCFGKGNQDPHALDILPSYVREMNDADLWIQVGNDIEAAWYPDLISNVKNTKILDGQEGFLDLSQGVMELKEWLAKRSVPRSPVGCIHRATPITCSTLSRGFELEK